MNAMRSRKPFQSVKRLVNSLLTTTVAVSFLGAAVLTPLETLAQAPVPVPLPTQSVGPIDIAAGTAGVSSGVSNATVAANSVKQTAWEILKISLTNTAELAILNGAHYFAQKLAYDTANYIASGGKGQKPLFSWKGIKGEVTSAAQDAAGEVLGTLSQDPSSFGKFGFNLCAPSDPRAALNIKLGFLNGLPGILGSAAPAAPKPKCTWDSISNNWDSFASQDSSTVLSQVGVMFTPGQNSLSAAIEVNNAAINLMNEKRQEAVNKFVANSGFKDLTDKISGNVKTPADTIKQQLNISQQESWKEGDKTVAISGSAFANGAFGVLTAAMQTFAGTLASKTLKKVFEKGLISINDLLGSESDKTLTFDAAPAFGGRAAAELTNASLLTPKILSITNYSALNDLAACPVSGRGPNNCALDEKFFTAVSRASQGSALTVRQAVAQGLLNRNWALLPASHRKNVEPTCYKEAFCYSNLVKLRKASVLPIGWEMAANSPFNDATRPVTLGEAMDRFEDCPRTPSGDVDTAKLPDSLHPWCHFVNPEWVLKYPDEICRQQAPGPQLISSQTSERAPACVDAATCIAQDASGNCIGGYGYCVREKNVWNLDADACPAQYASCTTFKRTSDGASSSFLFNTLDAGSCNSQNAGCRRYSQSQNNVPNPSFEDVLNGSARDWTVPAGAVLDRSGLFAEQGNDAVGVLSGQAVIGRIYSLLPGTRYALSGSVLQELESSAPVGTMTLRFYKTDGAPAADSALSTTCLASGSGDAVSLSIAATHLGYLSGTCEVTTPADAASGAIELTGNATSAGNRTWFDDIGLFSDGTYSASPYDSLLMNGKVEKCASGQAGCTDLVRMSSAALNLVRNPGFETPSPSGGPIYWKAPTAASYLKGTLKGFEGVSAMRLDPAGVSQDVPGLLAAAAYGFSVYSKIDGTTAGNPKAVIQIFDASQPPRPVEPTSVDGCVISGAAMSMALAAGSEYARSTCVFTAPENASFARITLSAEAGSAAVADAAQFELSVRSTAYHEGYAPGAQHVYLKTAPAGLNCGGPNPPSVCARFAPSCRRDEVGCDSYTPVDGGSAIPAVTIDGDACPSECVGYDAFSERASNFNDARFPLFLIPSTARSCTAAEAGCSEFTNVQELSRGGESREYFNYLRLCAKPDQNAGTFYTWEGNDARGYQLRTWALLKSDVASAATGLSDPTGGNAPCTKLAYDAGGRPFCADDDASVAAASCRKVDLLLNPDCREFYDAAGNIHYRLYSKTVVVSDSCTEYRITRSTQAECGGHGGFWKNGECHYQSYAPESQSCRAAAAGCRAYSGNASANVRVAFTDGFEDGTTGGWMAEAPASAVNSNESVSAGGHSLKASRASGSPVIGKDVARDLRQGKSYVLTFWAKGSGDLSIAFSAAGDAPFTFNRAANTDAPVALGTEWRPYQVGPVTLTKAPVVNAGDPAQSEQLRFTLSGATVPSFYLDNVELREITSDLYRIQDSWKTPASCDQTPSGDPSPQYMLGCRAYVDRLKKVLPLKSFDRICRPEAAGCEAMYETRHTASPFPQTFGALCSIASSCVPSGGSVNCACQIAGQTVCQVAAGSSTCRYDAAEEVPASQVSSDGDTVRIPADSIVYLVNDTRFKCGQADVGCTAMGDKTLNRERNAVQSWATKYYKDDPAQYANTLCEKSEEYCQAYTRNADGSSAYFKDPQLRTCEFKAASAGSSGWFKTGTDEPCYADFLEAGSRYGIWKNSDADYDAWAGVCQGQFDMCKEFIDPLATSPIHPGGQPYYAILNDRLDTQTCQNQVSLTSSPSGAESASACALFWQTDDLNKTYDASATYEASDARHGRLVNAVSGAANDTNVVIKVQRDRQCSQWLDCRSSETVFNSSAGQYQSVCTSFGVCAEYEHSGNTTRCLRYVEGSYAGQTLTPKVYASRDTSWKGEEFTSFAIPNEYSVDELVTVNVGSSSASPDYRLVRVQGACTGAYGSSCGPAIDPGTCLGPADARKCVYPIDNGRKVTDETQLKQGQTIAGYPGNACRAYPDANAPFPSSVADPNGWNVDAASLNNGNPVLISPASSFASANICQRRLDANGVEVSDCECNYLVGKYGGGTKYFPADSPDVPLGYCDSGAFTGYECDPLASGDRTKNNLSCCTQTASQDAGAFSFGNDGCDDGARCTRLSKLDREVGYEGQCLERDYTTPINGRRDQYACLTWRPVGLVGGTRDIYNQNQTAGYFAAADRRFYCVGARTPWTVKFDINPQSGGRPDTTQSNGGPSGQDTNNYFGHGTVVDGNPSHAMSQNLNCAKVDDSNAGDWCVWPTDATASYGVQTTTDANGASKAVTCTGSEGQTGSPCGSGYMCHYNTGDTIGKCVTKDLRYRINNDAIGILGCYEVSDEGSYKSKYIDYPYIGPPLYRQQLQSIYFQMTNDIYRDGDRSRRANNPTNPYNAVEEDCNDENGDSLIDPNGDSHAAINDSDVTLTETREDGTVVSVGRSKGLRYLEESSGWSTDVANGNGTVVLSAAFDKNGLLSSVRVAADDRSDSGTFGINRMGFVFKPGCQQIAQVDQTGEFGSTQGFTNIVNSVRTFDPNEGLAPPRDVYGEGWALENACRPFGAVGAISTLPPRKPWTYVASRLVSDVDQCTVTDYTKAATYRLESPEAIAAGTSEANAPFASLRRLFRSITALWEYIPLTSLGTGGTYQQVSDAAKIYDETGTVNPTALGFRTTLGSLLDGLSWTPPRVAAVDINKCDSANRCEAGFLDDVTINGRMQGKVIGADGTLNVAAEFYAWASHNAMPILQRTMLWGDLALAEPPAKGWYKNQKPFCSPDTSDQNAIGECRNFPGLTCSVGGDCPNGQCQKGANAFGNTPGACNAAPYRFNHTYTCSLRELEAMPKCVDDASNLAVNAPCYRMVLDSPICVYRPAVQITDNWGWCNCTGSACETEGGAYKDGCNTANPPSNARPWTEFAGEVDLGPTSDDAKAFVPGAGSGGGGGGGGGGLGASGGVAVNDSFTAGVNGANTKLTGPSLLANDTLTGGVSTRQLLVVDLPLHGTILPTIDPFGTNQLTPDGYFNYKQNSGYKGTDSFSYKIVQDGNDSNVAIVALTIP